MTLPDTSQPSIVILIGGRIGSGKTAVAIRLGRVLNCPVSSFGDVIRSEVQSRGLVQSRDNLQKIGGEIACEQPQDLCRRVIALSGWQMRGPLVVEGLRHVEVLSVFRSLVKPIPSLFVLLDTSMSVRISRIVVRGDSNQDLYKLDMHPTEIQAQGGLRSIADLVLDGSRDLEYVVESILSAIAARTEK